MVAESSANISAPPRKLDLEVQGWHPKLETQDLNTNTQLVKHRTYA